MCILSYIYGSNSLELGEDIELFYVVQDFCLVTVYHVIPGCYQPISWSTTMNEMELIFIHSWHLFHSIWKILHSCLISLSGDLECNFIQLWQMFHSMFHFCWPHFNHNFIPWWQLLHSLFHSTMVHGSSFMQYFIPSGIHFNQIFISLQQLLHSLLILSHFPLAAISCNISFLLAFISIKFSFHLAFISIKFSFLLVFISFCLAFRAHPMGHQEGGHMTWYLKC